MLEVISLSNIALGDPASFKYKSQRKARSQRVHRKPSGSLCSPSLTSCGGRYHHKEM